jgi:hypothetical protein
LCASIDIAMSLKNDVESEQLRFKCLEAYVDVQNMEYVGGAETEFYP